MLTKITTVMLVGSLAASLYQAGWGDPIDRSDLLRDHEGRGPGLPMVLNRRAGELEFSVALPAAVSLDGVAVTCREAVPSLKNGSVMWLVP